MRGSSVPDGSVIERTYFAVPQTYSGGDEFTSFIAATRAALARRDEVKAQVTAGYPANWPGLDEIAQRAADVKAVVDLRWVIKYPDGGGTDMVVDRTNVAHLSVEHCDRMEALGIA